MCTFVVVLPNIPPRSTALRCRGPGAQMALSPALQRPRPKGTAWPRSTPVTPVKASSDLGATQSDLKTRLATQQILGANIPCNCCGWDYGYTYWNSNLKYANCGYKAKFFETAFTTLHGMGANTARLSLFFDGRSAPQFGETRDTYNTVSGLQRPLKQDGRNFPDNTFLGDFLAMLKLAQAHAISIIPTLWSFEAMRPNQSGDTQFSGSHEGLFELSENADAFVKNALTPLLDGVEKAGLQSTILAWDIINEPEWAIREANEKFQPAPKVPLAQMQRFVGKCAAAIHRKGALATVGSARTSWNWENAQTAQEEGKQWKDFPLTNFWGDADLIKAAGDSLAYLDLYQVHYYDIHMAKPAGNPRDVFQHPAAYLVSSGKPIILGEIPGKFMPELKPQDCTTKAKARVEWCKKNGFAGILFWSYAGGSSAKGDGFGDHKYFQGAFPLKPAHS